MSHEDGNKKPDSNENLEKSVAQFVIDTLALEDLDAESMNPDQPLFGEGLGLDSVDALELGVALQKHYGIKIDPKDDSTKLHFSSVRSLAALIASRTGPDNSATN